MCKVNIYEAKTNLSKYVEMLETGKEEEIVITRYDKKVAKIILFEQKNSVKRLGAAKGILEDKPFVLKGDDDELATLFGYQL